MTRKADECKERGQKTYKNLGYDKSCILNQLAQNEFFNKQCEVAERSSGEKITFLTK